MEPHFENTAYRLDCGKVPCIQIRLNLISGALWRAVGIVAFHSVYAFMLLLLLWGAVVGRLDAGRSDFNRLTNMRVIRSLVNVFENVLDRFERRADFDIYMAVQTQGANRITRYDPPVVTVHTASFHKETIIPALVIAESPPVVGPLMSKRLGIIPLTHAVRRIDAALLWWHYGSTRARNVEGRHRSVQLRVEVGVWNLRPNVLTVFIGVMWSVFLGRNEQNVDMRQAAFLEFNHCECPADHGEHMVL